jgi:hypothetical protein
MLKAIWHLINEFRIFLALYASANELVWIEDAIIDWSKSQIHEASPNAMEF